MKVGDKRSGSVSNMTPSELETELEEEQTVEENMSESGLSSNGQELSSNNPESSFNLADKDRALRLPAWDRFLVLWRHFVSVFAGLVVECTEMTGISSSATGLKSGPVRDE